MLFIRIAAIYINCQNHIKRIAIRISVTAFANANHKKFDLHREGDQSSIDLEQQYMEVAVKQQQGERLKFYYKNIFVIVEKEKCTDGLRDFFNKYDDDPNTSAYFYIGTSATAAGCQIHHTSSQKLNHSSTVTELLLARDERTGERKYCVFFKVIMLIIDINF